MTIQNAQLNYELYLLTNVFSCKDTIRTCALLSH